MSGGTPIPATPGRADSDVLRVNGRSRSHVYQIVVELSAIGLFYLAYSAVRNTFGSNSVSPAVAFENAHDVIAIERSLGLFFEPELQALFLSWEALVRFLNVFYGTSHFIVTAGTLIWLFTRLPAQYRLWRNTLAATTALGIVGFSLFPVMPPRLLADCGRYGACSGPALVDTIVEIQGPWTVHSGTMEAVSNQYAAVPSLHFAWSAWCSAVAIFALRRLSSRILAVSYSALTLLAVLVTANHYWLDAALGALAFGAGFVLARLADHFLYSGRQNTLEGAEARVRAW